MTFYVIWTHSNTGQGIKIFGITTNKEEAEEARLTREKERESFQKKLEEWVKVHPSPPWYNPKFDAWTRKHREYAKFLHPEARDSCPPPEILFSEVEPYQAGAEVVVE